MSAVCMLIRAELRRRWRTWAGLSLTVGMLGGAVMALVADAHRTDSVYGRFLARQQAADLILESVGPGGPLAPSNRSLMLQAARLPQVSEAGLSDYVAMVGTTDAGVPLSLGDWSPLAVEDGRAGSSISRLRILAGRGFDPTRADEAVVGSLLAERAGLHPGSVVRARLLSQSDIDAARRGGVDPGRPGDGPQVTLHVVGVEISPTPGELPPIPLRTTPPIYLTPAFWQQHHGEYPAGDTLAVRLRHGAADIEAYTTEVERLGGGQAYFTSIPAQRANVERSLHLEALAVAVLAAVAGLSMLAVLGQTLARQTHLESAATPALRALGVLPRQLLAVHLVRACAVALPGVLVAVAVAILLSPLTPVGSARLAEPDPGLAVDGPVLAGTAAVMALLILVLAAPSAWRASRPPAVDVADGDRAGRGAPWSARLAYAAALPPPAIAGIRFAVPQGVRQQALAVRAAVAACAMSVATVAGVLVVTVSLAHLLDTPRLYGWNWDVALSPYDSEPPLPALARLPAVAAVATETNREAAVDGVRMQVLAVGAAQGEVRPALTGGRPPGHADEIMLGARTLAAVAVGRSVSARIGDREVRLRVVGRGVLPAIGDSAHNGEGAWVTLDALRRLVPDAEADAYLIRFRSGVDPAAGSAALTRVFGAGSVYAAQTPTDLSGFASVTGVPLAVAGLLIAAGAATLGPHPRDLGAAPPTRPRHPQDRRFHPPAGLRRRRLAGDRHRRDGAGPRHPRGCRRGPVGVERRRHRARHRRRAGDPRGRDPAHDPGGARHRQPRRRRARPACRAHPGGAGAPDRVSPVVAHLPATLVALAWLAAGATLLRSGVDRRLGRLIVGLVLLPAAALLDGGGGPLTALHGLALALLPAAGLHLLAALPDGRLITPARRAAIVAGYAGGLALGAVAAVRGVSPPAWVVAAEGLIAAGAGCAMLVTRYPTAGGRDRARLQWVLWGLVVAAGLIALSAVALVLVDQPRDEAAVITAATVIVPLSLALSTASRVVAVDRLLVGTLVVIGVGGMLVLVDAGAVVLLGRTPTSDESALLALSMAAAGLALVLQRPVARRVVRAARRLVDGGRRPPETILRDFAGQMSRTVPLDETLLEMAETLHDGLSLRGVEVWTGSDEMLERSVRVPEREPARMPVPPETRPVITRAGVCGPVWARLWLPQLGTPCDADNDMRVAPIAHMGELLGLLVVWRATGEPFSGREATLLAGLARQLGLALHTLQLDSALQTSLRELARQAEELQASRARIVRVADAERRRIERDLHDGAQQHLVALAVKIGLARELAQRDPAEALPLLAELGVDAREAVNELRRLAHGIYPPLLLDRGLGEAISAAATRSPQAVEVRAGGVRRQTQEVEAAVYFCCLEALQNAAKHAGPHARVRVCIEDVDAALTFSVEDDGEGFDVDARPRGGGFTNMSDRLGAVGGQLTVTSTPGEGTRVSGRVPAGSTTTA